MHLVVGIIHAFGHITAIAILATALVFMARGSHYSSVQGNELTDKPVRIASYVIVSRHHFGGNSHSSTFQHLC